MTGSRFSSRMNSTRRVGQDPGEKRPGTYQDTHRRDGPGGRCRGEPEDAAGGPSEDQPGAEEPHAGDHASDDLLGRRVETSTPMAVNPAAPSPISANVLSPAGLSRHSRSNPMA
jgi:hypothetical protein